MKTTVAQPRDVVRKNSGREFALILGVFWCICKLLQRIHLGVELETATLAPLNTPMPYPITMKLEFIGPIEHSMSLYIYNGVLFTIQKECSIVGIIVRPYGVGLLV